MCANTSFHLKRVDLSERRGCLWTGYWKCSLSHIQHSGVLRPLQMPKAESIRICVNKCPHSTEFSIHNERNNVLCIHLYGDNRSSFDFHCYIFLPINVIPLCSSDLVIIKRGDQMWHLKWWRSLPGNGFTNSLIFCETTRDNCSTKQLKRT